MVDVRRVLFEVVRSACVDGPAPGVVVHEIHPLQQGAGVFPALPPIPILVATNFTTCFRLWKTESNLSAQPGGHDRSEEHTSELQSLMRISYAVFCLKKKRAPTDEKHNRQKIHKDVI